MHFAAEGAESAEEIQFQILCVLSALCGEMVFGFAKIAPFI